jgi:hypothetical protein
VALGLGSGMTCAAAFGSWTSGSASRVLIRSSGYRLASQSNCDLRHTSDVICR